MKVLFYQTFLIIRGVTSSSSPTDKGSLKPLGDFLCIPTPNTGQLNPLFHTFVKFRLIVNRIVTRQYTDWLAANAQFSLNDEDNTCHRYVGL